MGILCHEVSEGSGCPRGPRRSRVVYLHLDVGSPAVRSWDPHPVTTAEERASKFLFFKNRARAVGVTPSVERLIFAWRYASAASHLTKAKTSLENSPCRDIMGAKKLSL